MPIQAAKVRFCGWCLGLCNGNECPETALCDRWAHDALGPCLPVDLTTSCLAAFPEADVGLCCSILTPQITAVRTELPFTALKEGSLGARMMLLDR